MIIDGHKDRHTQTRNYKTAHPPLDLGLDILHVVERREADVPRKRRVRGHLVQGATGAFHLCVACRGVGV